MKDSGLLLLSLIISALGLTLLYYTSKQPDSESYVKISQIDYDSVGNWVTIAGEIKSRKTHRDGHIFLKLGDTTGNISVVLFNPLAEKLDWQMRNCLRQGDFITVRGRVNEYRGSLEVVPRRGGDVECLKLSP